MAMTAREAAWTALQRWRKNGAWSDAALNAVLQNAQLEPRDAALAARICYGTLQNLTLLDHYLSAYCTTPLQKLEPKVLDLLRLSAYQIVLLDKVPPRAAVNEAVALCRKGGCARASGLVNAVLRRVAEHRDALPEIPGAGTADYLAVRYSHPRWLAQLYIDAHGYAFAERALAANNADAPACLQVNTLKTTADALAASLRADGIETEPHPWLPDALLCRGGNLAAARAFTDGWFYVQDAAAHCASLVSGAQLTILAFSTVFGEYGKYIVSIALTLFAFSTILGWEYYGEKALEYLVSKRPAIMAYRVIFSAVTFIGATSALEMVWNFSDTMNGLMAIPNLICLLWLNKDVANECFEYEHEVVAREKQGEQVDYQQLKAEGLH